LLQWCALHRTRALNEHALGWGIEVGEHLQKPARSVSLLAMPIDAAEQTVNPPGDPGEGFQGGSLIGARGGARGRKLGLVSMVVL